LGSLPTFTAPFRPAERRLEIFCQIQIDVARRWLDNPLLTSGPEVLINSASRVLRFFM
jgi:hypothetical protein